MAYSNFCNRHFPDGETYLRLLSEVKGKNIVLVCSLSKPDDKFLPLIFLAKALKTLGSLKITLVTPYLSYMRQDKIFKPGEALTSAIFADLLSQFVDWIITVDHHLYRRKNMNEIYSIPCTVLHTAPLISQFIQNNIERPLIIGPASESEQWVSEVAANAGVPFVILQKIRLGDRDVEVSVRMVDKYRDHTPVLVDDIVSTARTMIETVKHINDTGLRKPVCIATHGVFVGNAYNELLNAGAEKVITSNTIVHLSNQIDISEIIAECLVI